MNISEKIDYEVIISSCDKFSDLWDAHIFLLGQNWKERGKTYLLTDLPAECSLEDVELVCAGAGTEITQRLKSLLERVKTKYILFTLDDYFLTEPIDNAGLQRALAIMEKEQLDYLLLHAPENRNVPSERDLRREGAAELGDTGCYLRNVAEGNYKVSLYPGLWRTDFMRATLDQTRNAWEYEVALTEMANQLQARCAASTRECFPFLDVIRKGKVLRKARKYFEKNPIYTGQRETMTFWAEWKLDARAWLSKNLPRPLFRALKRLMIKCGMTFYSPVK